MIFSNNFPLTLILDLEIEFKVTAHPLPKGTMWVNWP